MKTHGRNGLALAVLGAALALVPGTAAAADLKIYKAERHLDLVADERTDVKVSCDSGDHALDGMWRIDHADDDEYLSREDNITKAVDVLEAYALSDGRTYSFRFVKNAIGKVQVKMFVTCLHSKTVGGTHFHNFDITNPGASPTSATGMTTTHTEAGATARSFAGDGCPSGWIVAAPGFQITNYPVGGPPEPDEGMVRPLESNLLDSDMRDWSFRIDFSLAVVDPTVKYTARCLKIRIPPGASGEKHKLVPTYKALPTVSIGANTESTRQLDCKAHSKAIVAGWKINTPAKTWYLGMDPRIKSRAFRFYNKDATTDTVDLAAICLNYRTT